MLLSHQGDALPPKSRKIANHLTTTKVPTKLLKSCMRLWRVLEYGSRKFAATTTTLQSVQITAVGRAAAVPRLRPKIYDAKGASPELYRKVNDGVILNQVVKDFVRRYM